VASADDGDADVDGRLARRSFADRCLSLRGNNFEDLEQIADARRGRRLIIALETPTTLALEQVA
jgi:hypothetical protein